MFNRNNCINHDFSNYQVEQEIPYFNASCHAEHFIYWFHKVDKFIGYIEIFEEKQAKYVARKLQGYVSTWWKQLQYDQRRQYKQPIRTWHKMRKLMSSRFLQTNHGQILYLQYQRKLESKQLFQGNFDSQYSSQFNNYYGIVDIQTLNISENIEFTSIPH